MKKKDIYNYHVHAYYAIEKQKVKWNQIVIFNFWFDSIFFLFKITFFCWFIHNLSLTSCELSQCACIIITKAQLRTENKIENLRGNGDGGRQVAHRSTYHDWKKNEPQRNNVKVKKVREL